jgi:hypothetical protein
MANKKVREARRIKRERIRLGPSDAARAMLTLLGIEITPWPARREPIKPDDDPFVAPPDPLRTRAEIKAWLATVADTPHIAKLLYCTCDEHWIAEAKMLKLRADKYRAEHPNTVLLPHGWGNHDAFLGPLVKGVHYGKKTQPEIQREMWRRMGRYAIGDMRRFFGADFAKTEARIAGHIHDETLIELKEKQWPATPNSTSTRSGRS